MSDDVCRQSSIFFSLPHTLRESEKLKSYLRLTYDHQQAVEKQVHIERFRLQHSRYHR